MAYLKLMHMSFESVAISSKPESQPAALTLVICRDCCCGTVGKHPDFDHALQLRQIKLTATEIDAKVRVSRCLDECQHSNVIVVHRKAQKRESIWLGGVLSARATEALTQWISINCDGEVPQSLHKHVFTPKKAEDE